MRKKLIMHKKTESEMMNRILGPSYDVKKEIAETKKKVEKDKGASGKH